MFLDDLLAVPPLWDSILHMITCRQVEAMRLLLYEESVLTPLR
jgi:hypothetical protein